MKISTTFKTQTNFIWIFSWARIFQALTTSIFQQNLYLHCNAGIRTEETVELKKENPDLQQEFVHSGNKTKKMKKVMEYLFGTVLPCFAKNWQKKYATLVIAYLKRSWRINFFIATKSVKMGVNLKISPTIVQIEKLWSCTILVDFFISREGIYPKINLTNATRLIHSYMNG